MHSLLGRVLSFLIVVCKKRNSWRFTLKFKCAYTTVPIEHILAHARHMYTLQLYQDIYQCTMCFISNVQSQLVEFKALLILNVTPN
jgi:hypothetical protein